MSLGPMEMLLLLGIALLVFGPSRLPGLGKSMGEAIRGFKKAMDGEDEPGKQDSVKPTQISGSSAPEQDKEQEKEKEKNKV